MPLIIPGNRLASTGFTIDQSARFDQTAGAYLQDPNSNAGDSRKKFTFSTWFKRGVLGDNIYFYSYRYDDSNLNNLYFDTNDKLNWIDKSGGSTQMNLITNRAFRDPAAFYHIVVVWDTARAGSSDRAKIYINGVLETSFSTQTYPSQNADSGGAQRSGSNMRFGALGSNAGITDFFDGYFAESHYSDNYAYEPSNYGEFSNGIWIPIEVDISYGSAGFYFDYADSSNLGANTKGKGNYTVATDQGTGLAAHDQVFDTPTNNFCVLNPISKPSYGSYADRNVTGQNLQVTENGDGVVQSYGYGTFAISSGKWYYEFYTNTYPAANAIAFGWIELENAMTATDSGSSWKTPGMNQRHTSSSYSSWTWGLNNSTATGLSEFGQGVVIGVTTDFDNNTFTLTKNGSAYGSVDFDSVSPTYTLSGVEHLPILFFGADGASLATLNFGQDSTFNGALSAGGNADGNGHGNFKYAVPSGALAICSRNLGS